MSYIGITGNGPTYEYPFVEENAGHRLRPVVIKNRKVKGKRGWLLRRVGRYFAPDGSPEGLGHKALQVGNHLHELHTDEANQKYLVVQRLTGPQIWQSTIGESIKGYTYMTDQDVADHGECYNTPKRNGSNLTQPSNASPILDARSTGWQIPRP